MSLIEAPSDVQTNDSSAPANESRYTSKFVLPAALVLYTGIKKSRKKAIGGRGIDKAIKISFKSSHAVQLALSMCRAGWGSSSTKEVREVFHHYVDFGGWSWFGVGSRVIVKEQRNAEKQESDVEAQMRAL